MPLQPFDQGPRRCEVTHWSIVAYPLAYDAAYANMKIQHQILLAQEVISHRLYFAMCAFSTQRLHHAVVP
eukprot:8752061-Pyramimonas_sp.AAC.1